MAGRILQAGVRGGRGGRLRRLVVDADAGEFLDDGPGRQQVLDREANTPVGAGRSRGDDCDHEAATQLGLTALAEVGDIRRVLEGRGHQFDAAGCTTKQGHRLPRRPTGTAHSGQLVDPHDDVRAVRDRLGADSAPVESDLVRVLPVGVAHSTKLAISEAKLAINEPRRAHLLRNDPEVVPTQLEVPLL